MKGMTIIEVVAYGPICAADEDTGFLVTVNGSYVNLWVPCGDGSYENTDCVANSEWGHMYSMSAGKAIERAEECLAKWLKPEED